MTYSEILSRFKVKTSSNGKAQCICPAHNDRQASLTITDAGDKTLLHCHAGCTVENIVAAAGIEMKDLYTNNEIMKVLPATSNDGSNTTLQSLTLDQYAESKKLPKDWLHDECHLITQKNYSGQFKGINYVRFPYTTEDGSVKCTRRRYGKKEFRWNSGDKLGTLYGEWRLPQIRESGYVILVEGESDTQTLMFMDLPALGVPGADTFKRCMTDKLHGLKDVYIHVEKDMGGETFLKKITRTLAKIPNWELIGGRLHTFSCSDINGVFDKEDPDFIKDPSDAYMKLGLEQAKKEICLLLEIADNEGCIDLDEVLKQQANEIENQNNELLSCGQSENLNKGSLRLLMSDDGKPLQMIFNIIQVLEYDSRFLNKLRFDDFSQNIYLVGSTPWDKDNKQRPWGSYDDTEAFNVIQSQYKLKNRQDYQDAVVKVAHDHSFNQVKDKLNSLDYKGKGYIRRLLPKYLGCEDNDYNFNVIRVWMLGAAARIYVPGIKFDYTPIFTGQQGLGKSTFLRKLAINADWYNDSLDTLDGKEAAEQLMGSWIIELPELKALGRTRGGMDSVKQFLTKQSDKYRFPYAKRTDILNRQCVFAGTTNKITYLDDITGNRRFLPVECGINIPSGDIFSDEAINDIAAAWAETVYEWKNEDPRLVLPKEYWEIATQMQERASVDDGRIGLIEQFLSSRRVTCNIEIWKDCLNADAKTVPQMPRYECVNIAQMLNTLGWKKADKKMRVGDYGVQLAYIKDNSQIQSEFVPCEDDEDLPFD